MHVSTELQHLVWQLQHLVWQLRHLAWQPQPHGQNRDALQQQDVRLTVAPRARRGVESLVVAVAKLGVMASPATEK